MVDLIHQGGVPMSLAKEAGSVAATEWTPSLAAIDLDGTLLDAEGRLSPYNKEVLRRWVNSGRALALVSARSPGGIKPILGELDVECAVGAFNGSFVWMGVGSGERM
jgi:hydroxymethylpyrimidine pyrophosphatase-like HAD family hydrolase